MTADAKERAASLDGTVTDPPASNEDETPYCFGLADPAEYPCAECAVAGDCQLKNMGF